MDVQDISPLDCSEKSRNAATSDGPTPGERTEAGWQAVPTLRQKKQMVKEKKAAARGTATILTTSSTEQPTQKKAGFHPRRRRHPLLPKDDFKIALRPHKGLSIKELSSLQLADAVVAACQNQVTGTQCMLRLRPGSNVVLVSTLYQHVTDRVRCLTDLPINGRARSINAYVTTPNGAFRGVIHGIEPNTTPE